MKHNVLIGILASYMVITCQLCDLDQKYIKICGYGEIKGNGMSIIKAVPCDETDFSHSYSLRGQEYLSA